jgi:imidazolonepropionase-like amidohydrolase
MRLVWRRACLWVASLGVLSLGACAEPRVSIESRSESPAAVAITDVTIVPMDSERVLSGYTVVISGDRIAAVGPTAAIEVPNGASRIDGNGRFLVPGLVDAHVHLRDASELLGYLAHGVTTVVHLSGPTGNITSVVDLKSEVQRGTLPGPTIYTSGRLIDGDPPIYRGVSSVVGTREEAAQAVNEQAASGVDLIKVYNNLRRAPLEEVVRAAHARGLSVWGHIPRIDGRTDALRHALTAGVDVIAHAEEVFFTALYGSVEGQLDRGVAPAATDALIGESVRLIADRRAVVVPNLSFVAMTRAQLDDMPGVLSDPEAAFLHPLVFDMWRTQNPTTRADRGRFDLRERGKQDVVRRLTRLLQQASVPLLLGTDASAPGMFPGKSAHLELQELVFAGLTPYEAMATATANAGAFLGARMPGRPSFGTIREGRRADLVLLERSPLADIRNIAAIAGVAARGRWYSSSELAQMRKDAAERGRP